ncbi:helix-turn-helix domain-containing protein [Labrenzia sp. DG1229]|uniref:IclR family transcriptional regulator n=1 Tax=Labrenzia sp. DG1229 TaxID=681847 RepID=UPI0007C87900|nr:helix-turn-helix domain-containing protein [Labrenzia sp. DG1229]
MKNNVRPKGNLLQTLQRGMETLTHVADSPDGLSVAQLADKLQVDRAIAYRIVATLEADAFVWRAANGNIFLGGAVLALVSSLEPQLRSIVEPELNKLAEDTRATAFMSVARGLDAVAILVAESNSGLIRVGYRIGSRHPLKRGAAGIAILAGRPERSEDSDEVRAARRDGYSITRGQLQRGAVGIAAPLRFSGKRLVALEASIGVVALDDLDTEMAAPMLMNCAAQISQGFSGASKLNNSKTVYRVSGDPGR